MEGIRSTTIVAVKRNGKTAIAGDGQVTVGEKFIIKNKIIQFLLKVKIPIARLCLLVKLLIKT